MGDDKTSSEIQADDGAPDGDDRDALKDLAAFDLQAQDRLISRGLAWRFNLQRGEEFFELVNRREKQNEEELDFLEQVVAASSITERLARLNARLDELDRASRTALQEAERRTQEAAERLRKIREQAALTADGRRIYRTHDGKHAFYEDGRAASDAEREAIEWKPNMPTWEERQRAGGEFETAVTGENEIREYRERLQHTREKLEGGEPLGADEIEKLELDIETMPDAVREHLSQGPVVQKSAAHEFMKDDPLPAAPDVSASFDQAVAGPSAPTPQSTQPARVIRRDV